MHNDIDKIYFKMYNSTKCKRKVHTELEIYFHSSVCSVNDCSLHCRVP